MLPEAAVALTVMFSSPKVNGASIGSDGVTTTVGLGSQMSLTVYSTSIVSRYQISAPSDGLVIITVSSVTGHTTVASGSSGASSTFPTLSLAIL